VAGNLQSSMRFKANRQTFMGALIYVSVPGGWILFPS
jgi:hypothetical protein